jgi:hypothetical protein
VSLFAGYQLGLRTGYLRWRTQDALKRTLAEPPGPLAKGIFSPPNFSRLRVLLSEQKLEALRQQCNEISAGKMRIFSEQVVAILGPVPGVSQDWSAFKEKDPHWDVKFLWEPARFGWVFPLVQAALFTGEGQYLQAFLELSERFMTANPPYFGIHWVSGQEVAIRLLSLIFASQYCSLSESVTSQQLENLKQWIAIHAARIPPTLAYARAQNNNHLLSEAAGLFCAGLALPEHPQAQTWQRLGWAWLEKGLRLQIAESGEYIQHSANYHRLMLQLVLWVTLVGERHNFRWSKLIHQRIQAAIHWLAALVEPSNGHVPNLGPNDGAALFPLTQCPFEDYRPVLQAAARVFFQKNLFPEGPWDDYGIWLGVPEPTKPPGDSSKAPGQPLTIHHPRCNSWCYLRAAHFKSRPGHADQLHLDLWWRGLNIALDPGTYRYTAPPPWDNALTHTAVHNTLTFDHREQMTRASRFLYLGWAQAQILARESETVAASQNGYRNIGLLQQRTVKTAEWGWQVEDWVTCTQNQPRKPVLACLHWLAPDWAWKLDQAGEEVRVSLESPHGLIGIQMKASSQALSAPMSLKPFLVRAGQLLYGEPLDQPTWGWSSPTYGVKIPALAFGVQTVFQPPFTIVTEWKLPSLESTLSPPS